MSNPVSICVIGSGYVGLVASVCFAEMGHDVICVDNDEARVRTLQEGGIPIHEEYLPELLSRHHANKLEFTTDLRAAAQAQDRLAQPGLPRHLDGGAHNHRLATVARALRTAHARRPARGQHQLLSLERSQRSFVGR